MIENHLVDKIHCLDQNTDTLELIESICSNTIVLDLRAVNDDYITLTSSLIKKWLRSFLRA